MAYMPDLFAGTAQYYDQYRPGIPDEVRNYILRSVKAPVSLLDLGTGTGRVLEQFTPYFTDTMAVEPDRDMAKLARERLRHWPVHVIEGTAEDAHLPDGWHASLVTIARAFHWMDRPLVLRKLEPVVAPNGIVAVFHDHSFWHLDAPWCDVVRGIVQEFLGEQRRAGSGTYSAPARPFTQDFAESVFSNVHKQTFPIKRHWTADQLIGMLYSTSFASKVLLGMRAERFEHKLRTALHSLSPADDFVERNTLQLFIARRP